MANKKLEQIEDEELLKALCYEVAELERTESHRLYNPNGYFDEVLRRMQEWRFKSTITLKQNESENTTTANFTHAGNIASESNN